MTLEEIQKSYRACIDTYESLEWVNEEEIRLIANEFAVILARLELEKVEYKKKWLGAYFEAKKSESSTAAEKIADNQVIELYQLRYILKGGYELLGMMRTTISSLRK